MTYDGGNVRLAVVATQRREVVRVQPGVSYPLLGVRWYGEGPFLRETVTTDTSKAKTLYRVRGGQLIYNRLFAWKGAFGVVPEEFDGFFVSGEFPVFDVRDDLTSPRYIALLLSSPAMAARIEDQSTGSAAVSRNRWTEDRFSEFVVPLPDSPVQAKRLSRIAAVEATRTVTDQLIDATRAALEAVREDALASTHISKVPLSALASIESRLVSPTEPGTRNLLHVGIDRIESRSGRLLPLRSAAEDEVTSGKFLFSPEDVIYSKIRPELRKAAFPEISGLCSADAYPLRPRGDVVPGYLLEVLLSGGFTQEAVARSARTKMPKINRADLFTIPVPLLSTPEQRQMAERLDSVRRHVLTAEAQRDALSALRQTFIDTLALNDEAAATESAGSGA